MTTFVLPERFRAAALAAANVALFAAAASLFTANFVGFSHHWLFPFHEGALFLQGLALARSGRFARTLTLLSALVLAVGAARLETIVEAGHLMHFSAALLEGAFLHAFLALPGKSPWRRFNLAASVFLVAAAGVAGCRAFAGGIDPGF